MKRILITGANSYIGISFDKYITDNFPDKYVVDTIDMNHDSWREKTFKGYDIIFHVAAIVHQKETKKNAQLFYKINRDLAVQTAEKAKKDGVKQFIFLSSMSVYGLLEGTITKNTVPNPKTHYGTSKLQAEEIIKKLQSDDFKVAIVRPPMVYGDGCKGNYETLCKIAKKMPVFPQYENRRSMVSIEKLCRYIQCIIDKEENGYFYPQDDEYVCTSYLVKKIAQSYNHKIILTRIFNPFIRILKFKTIKKVFGDLIYMDME